MLSGAFGRMQRAVISYINSQNTSNSNDTKINTAVQGKFSNGKVLIGNKNYPADLAVDMPIKDGDYVWCVIDDSGTVAVIVGM